MTTNAVGDVAVARPSIEAVAEAAVGFLKKLLQVRRVTLTRATRTGAEEGVWDVEAQVLLPNPAVNGLGLRLSREVLNSRRCVVKLDDALRVVSYGMRDEGDDEE